jgi:hypothetical protein
MMRVFFIVVNNPLQFVCRSSSRRCLRDVNKEDCNAGSKEPVAALKHVQQEFLCVSSAAAL